MSLYNGTSAGATPGLFSGYYFWESGAAWDAMVQYWALTGDTQYNGLVAQGLQWQAGPNNDYMPANQTKSEGNDDQAFWALAAMSAAERGFPTAGSISWVQLAKSVFDEQAARWDTKSCGGGLRWQIFTFNNGYNYKNSISTMTFFQLAARLAHYTGNSTYADWATTSYNWAHTVGLIDNKYRVFDGTDTNTNCSQINQIQWSYAAAGFLYGSAVMYNLSSGDAQNQWRSHTNAHLNNTASTFFNNSILYEVACEPSGNCNIDQRAFKALTSRYLAGTASVAPFTRNTISPLLSNSAQAALQTCSNATCAFSWGNITHRTTQGADDNGLGPRLAALEVVQGTWAMSNGNLLGTQNTTSNAANQTAKPSGTASGTGSPTGSAAAGATNTGAAGKLEVGLWSAGLLGGVAMLLI